VTGRLLRTGSLGQLEDILALPDLAGSARSPTFSFRLPVNLGKKEADVNMLAFLRVYTVDVVEDTVAVIGSCLVPFFNNKVLCNGSLHFSFKGMHRSAKFQTPPKAVDLL